jgi:hypothetical protein
VLFTRLQPPKENQLTSDFSHPQPYESSHS